MNNSLFARIRKRKDTVAAMRLVSAAVLSVLALSVAAGQNPPAKKQGKAQTPSKQPTVQQAGAEPGISGNLEKIDIDVTSYDLSKLMQAMCKQVGRSVYPGESFAGASVTFKFSGSFANAVAALSAQQKLYFWPLKADHSLYLVSYQADQPLSSGVRVVPSRGLDGSLRYSVQVANAPLSDLINRIGEIGEGKINDNAPGVTITSMTVGNVGLKELMESMAQSLGLDLAEDPQGTWTFRNEVVTSVWPLTFVNDPGATAISANVFPSSYYSALLDSYGKSSKPAQQAGPATPQNPAISIGSPSAPTTIVQEAAPASSPSGQSTQGSGDPPAGGNSAGQQNNAKGSASATNPYLTPTNQGATASQESTAVRLARIFNAITDGHLETAGESNRIHLKGPRRLVDEARRLLARELDIPYSTVRLDIWTIQVNTTNQGTGSQKIEHAQQNLDDIRAGIQLERDVTATLEGTFLGCANQIYSDGDLPAPTNSDGTGLPSYKAIAKTAAQLDLCDLQTAMAQAGFNNNPRRPLTFAEALVFLAAKGTGPGNADLGNWLSEQLLVAGIDYLAEVHQELWKVQTAAKARMSGKGPNANLYQRDYLTATRLLDLVVQMLDDFGVHDSAALAKVVSEEADNQKLMARATTGAERSQWRMLHVQQLLDIVQGTGQPAFRRLAQEFDPSGDVATRQGLYDFFTAWKLSEGSSPPNLDYATKLTQAANDADAMLKSVTDSARADFEDVTTTPLLQWVRNEIQQGNARSSGIDLVGTATITATSTTHATLAGKAMASDPSTQQPALSLTQLQAKATDIGVKGSVIQGITPDEALLLEAALNSPTTTSTPIAPGISVDVIPTVERDGGSARLKITINETMNNAPSDASNSGNDLSAVGGKLFGGLLGAIQLPSSSSSKASPGSSGANLDYIPSHQMTTDVGVTANDLFEISSFSMEHTTLGGPSWDVPLVDQIPLIGKIFQGPKTRVTKHQESVILVYVTLTPKAEYLAQGYIGS